MSLFGHHHAEPTFASHVSDVIAAVVHLPLPVWLTVIPILGGFAVAYVTHRLNLSRDRIALRRAEERRRADDERVAERVRLELASRAGRYRDALSNARRGGDIARLEAAHGALARGAAETDVIDVLGNEYLPFMSVLQREEDSLARLTSRDESARLNTEVDRATELAVLEASLAAYATLIALPNVGPP